MTILTFSLFTFPFSLLHAAPSVKEPKRDITVVRDYIRREVGDATLAEIKRREGGGKFLQAFLSDKDWMEQFAGSGICGGTPRSSVGSLDKSLKALDLLVWNDTTGFIDTKLGRNCATALALNHAHDWSDEKLVEVLDCYREWDADGTLDDSCRKLDVRQWRDVVSFGQNAGLPVEDLRWIHDYANLPPIRYGYFFWQTCSYRLFNCFGASVHGPEYYRPWQHRWNTNELRYRVGAVCGGLSKFGSHCAASHGMRSYTAGQPGHCAFMLWHFGDENRWGIDYAVTGHTGAHFSTGGEGFTACEEQDRYYRHPKRMAAEAWRWQGEYENAMRLAPGNWQAATEWADKLKQENAPAAKWDVWGKAVRETFADAPSQGWQLYVRYLDALGNARAAKIEAARLGLLAFTENKAPTAETLYIEDHILNPLAKRFEGDADALFELLPAMLDGQAKSEKFYQQTLAWTAGKMMDTKEHVKEYMTVITKNALKNKTKLDFNGMILTAGKNDDVQSFQQVFKLMQKMAPGSSAKPTGKGWALRDYGGELVSAAGLLKTVSTSQWDTPANYLSCISAPDFAAENGFHTHKNDNPWAIVMLAGDCEITGVTIVNSGGNDHNRRRQVPLTVSLSEGGDDFAEVWHTDTVESEWRIPLKTPRKAKYVKVERPKDDARKEDPFHLHKILVYGKKLY